jgi:DNA-binding MarR family transcriptional regulator
MVVVRNGSPPVTKTRNHSPDAARRERAPDAPPTEAEYAEAAALREALRAFQRRSEIVTRANGLTPRTYQLLLMIKTGRAAKGTAGLPELEDRLQLGKSTVTELVLRTEERGFVRRELDRTRARGIAVRLTPAGERRLAKVVRALGDERSHLIDVMSDLR